jgi:hypothetical protein
MPSPSKRPREREANATEQAALAPHPLANLFPLLEGEELAELVADYDYRPVRCPNCGWRGRRSLSRWASASLPTWSRSAGG